MRPTPNILVEPYRVNVPGLPAGHGNNGVFIIPTERCKRLAVVASDQDGWDHVSVHTIEDNGQRMGVPDWGDMCYVKSLFFCDYEVCFQLHPAKQQYVDNHPYTLHLWRCQTEVVPLPPQWMVGDPSLTAEKVMGMTGTERREALDRMSRKVKRQKDKHRKRGKGRGRR